MYPQIIVIAVLVWCVFLMLRRKSKIPDGQQSDVMLSIVEKIQVWIISLVNPIFGGAILYYGWKSKLPVMAKQANRISITAFLIELALIIILFFIYR